MSSEAQKSESDTGTMPTSPVTSPPNKNDLPESPADVEPSGDHEDVTWWSGWGSSEKWAKTLTGTIVLSLYDNYMIAFV